LYIKKWRKKERTGSRKKESLEQYSRNTSGIPRTQPFCLFILLFFQVCLYCYHLWDSALRQSLLSSCRYVYSEGLLFMKLTYGIWTAKRGSRVLEVGDENWNYKWTLTMHSDPKMVSDKAGEWGSDVCNCVPCHQLRNWG
jgi:hypothetical protein